MEYIIDKAIQQPHTEHVTATGMALVFIICTIILGMMSWEERRNTKRRDDK